MFEPNLAPTHVGVTYVKSGALASSRDSLRADSDLRAYGPCHQRDGTAGTPELLPQLPPQASALSVKTTGRQRSVGVWTSPPPPEPARLARVDYGPAMQLADEGRSDAVRRDRRLRDRRSGPTRQSRRTGLGEQC